MNIYEPLTSIHHRSTMNHYQPVPYVKYVRYVQIIEDPAAWFQWNDDLPVNSHGHRTSSLYTLWLFNIAMDNGLFIDGLPIKNGGSFHSYVSLPEGITYNSKIIPFFYSKMRITSSNNDEYVHHSAVNIKCSTYKLYEWAMFNSKLLVITRG